MIEHHEGIWFHVLHLLHQCVPSEESGVAESHDLVDRASGADDFCFEL